MCAPAAGDRRPVSRDRPLTVSAVTGTFQIVCTLTLVSRYAVVKSRNRDLKFEKHGFADPGYPVLGTGLSGGVQCS
eukprot:1174316-Rhodomonas_salina.1